jgi:methionyl-tRNA formyltransferase
MTPAMHVDRQIRACTPDPGAWTTFRGKRVKLDPVRPLEPAPAGPALAPGELVVDKHAVLVGTGTAPVRLGTVQAQGKRRMPAPDWARGVRVHSGERFE